MLEEQWPKADQNDVSIYGKSCFDLLGSVEVDYGGKQTFLLLGGVCDSLRRRVSTITEDSAMNYRISLSIKSKTFGK